MAHCSKSLSAGPPAGGARRVEAEWLDRLAPDDPRAVRSRHDLQRLNALMRNAAIVRREVMGALAGRALHAIAEIGAGDGSFMLRIVERSPAHWRPAQVVLVDQHDTVTVATLARLAARGWRARCVTADIATWLPERGEIFDVIIANLVLHHFEDRALEALFAAAALRTRVFVACEPRRSALALGASRLVGLIGCNEVTRYDAPISVRAGFAGCELSGLWPAGGAWQLREGARGLFSHCFVAGRHEERA